MAALARPRRAGAAAGAASPGALRSQGPSDAPCARATTVGRGGLLCSFSDLSAEDSELEAAGKAPLRRFLKAGGESAPGGRWKQPPGNVGPHAPAARGSVSHARSSSALKKVAQLESRIMNRKKQLGSRTSECGQDPSDESVSSASSREHSARGSKYRKNYARENRALGDARPKGAESSRNSPSDAAVKQQLGLGCDEEEAKELVKSTWQFSSRNRSWRVPVNDSKQMGKDSVVSSILPGTGNVKQSHVSLGSDGSEIKSLDELFSEASKAEDSASGSSNDFRVNILSLDDLASDIPNEISELKWKGTGFQNVQKSNRDPPKATFQVKNDQTSVKTTSAVAGMNDASEGHVEEVVTESEISEHLSEVSAAFPSHRQNDDDDDRTVNSEYSEDFEKSPSVTDSEFVAELSEEHSDSSTRSRGEPSSASSPSRERHDQAPRVAVKETAVQTLNSPFTYHWPETNNSAVLGPPLGNSYVDPVPIASHVISMDTVEALTAYSPSVLVLNDMLKQHLLLTQQFVENIHQLHRSLVASLEREQFHYHTLQEAKEYIKNHKSPPLTLEQALQELEKGQEQKLL
ncbi:uncharacterized protein C19orf44 homolog [Eudromia elegans]